MGLTSGEVGVGTAGNSYLWTYRGNPDCCLLLVTQACIRGHAFLPSVLRTVIYSNIPRHPQNLHTAQHGALYTLNISTKSHMDFYPNVFSLCLSFPLQLCEGQATGNSDPALAGPQDRHA